jgi:2',3'-cyclic-nucleotide 2'-phosphodiesterase (5'-nucleotidase family)
MSSTSSSSPGDVFAGNSCANWKSKKDYDDYYITKTSCEEFRYKPYILFTMQHTKVGFLGLKNLN